jgi:hypothetical protein
MSVFLLMAILIISFLIVRVGAVALELTGMSPEHARFQALSAFTGTGFTTREAESVVVHPQRRRIVSYLMLLGNAGIVSLIGTFLLSLRADSMRSWLTLGGVLAALVLLYWLAARTSLLRRLTDAIRRRLSRTQLVELTLEEILHQQEGYGIARIIIPDCSPLIGMSIAEAQFPGRHIIVLSRMREGHLTPVPGADERLAAFDELVCYGRLEAIQAIMGTCDPMVSSGQFIAAQSAAGDEPDQVELIHV